MAKKRALITGITGQDGSYLAEFLIDKGYEVHGLRRRVSLSTNNLKRIRHLVDVPQKESNLYLHYGDVTDSSNITRIIQEIQPDEIYNLAAQSHVKVSFETPEYTANSDAIGVLRILEAIRYLGLKDKTRFYQASTSELYGKVQEIPQTETTPFHPMSPYATAKLYAYWMVRNYREAYNIFAANGILFNHESPRRGESFVTRKITLAVVNILEGNQEKLYLGNLNAKRDWGYAPEYVEAMWKMLQIDTPEDFVIASGNTCSVREFVEKAFKAIDIEIGWEGKGIDEKGYNIATGRVLVEIDPYYFRPTEVDILVGDPSKAKKQLNWQATTSLEELVSKMVKSDLEYIKSKSGSKNETIL